MGTTILRTLAVKEHNGCERYILTETVKSSRLDILVYSHGAFVIQVEAEKSTKEKFCI